MVPLFDPSFFVLGDEPLLRSRRERGPGSARVTPVNHERS